jgi:hypothetical protein
VNLFINTSAADLSTAAVVSASNFTALDTLNDLPQLVVGRTEPMVLKFLSAPSTYEAWSGAADHTCTVALGHMSVDGSGAFAEATLSTLVDNGFSGDLELTSTRLKSAVYEAMTSTAPRLVPFTLEVTITDNAGRLRTFAQLPFRMSGQIDATP